jgi:hypothetical protein
LKSNINISPTISPDILKTISNSTPIKGFGSQVTDLAKEKLLSTPRGKITQLQVEKTVLKLKRIYISKQVWLFIYMHDTSVSLRTKCHWFRFWILAFRR